MTTARSGARTGVQDPGDVDDDLLVALQRLGRLMASRQVAGELATAAGADLSQQGVRLVRALRRCGRVPIAQLAASSEMDLAAVSRQLRALEEQGLVVRSPAPDDQRVHMVELSRAGSVVADRLRRVGVEHLSESLAAWSHEDRRRVAQLLGRLVDDLQRTDVRPPRSPGRRTTTKET